MARTFKLDIVQGSPLEQPFVYTDPPPGTAEDDFTDFPVDITDFEARMQVRRRVGSEEPLLDLTTGNGGLELDGPAGMVTVVVSAEDTAALTFSSAVWDLELVPPGIAAEPFRLIGGTCQLVREVTR